ncbi:uncharacterized protein LOC135492601 [Lineus longissimus]|uniref:uncharacterized protein LOC135492601 n=1 Tax=Lineus longissimus TaxID=88925 RepID=UPI00315D1780
MSGKNLPKTLTGAQSVRGTVKRTIASLIKEAKSLKDVKGLPEAEYLELVERLRSTLEHIRAINDRVIELSINEIPAGDPQRETLGNDIEAKEVEFFEKIADEVRPLTQELMAVVQRIRDGKPTTPPPPTSSVAATTSRIASRLAKLKFPTFSGDIRDYMRFKEQFSYFTKDLPPPERLYQLVESMERVREKVKIKNCTMLSVAWSILDTEFGDEDRLIDILISDIERTESYHTNNPGAMSKFVDSLQRFTVHFDSLGMKSDLNSRVILTQLRQKLPKERHILFLERVQDSKYDNTISGLLKFLQDQLVLVRKIYQDSGKTAKYELGSNSMSKSSTSRSVSHATVSPGPGTSERGASGSDGSSGGSNREKSSIKYGNSQEKRDKPKCPLHPQASNHFIKGCNKFRSLPQSEKFNVLNSSGICHRCGHDDCVSGKPPYNPEQCQYFRPCAVPTCGLDTHCSSIYPKVYGTDGYRHFEMKYNAAAGEFKPAATITKNVGTSVISAPCLSESSVPTLPTVMAYLNHNNKRCLVRILLDSGSQQSILREGIVPKTPSCVMQNFMITAVGGETSKQKLRVLDCILESLDRNIKRKITVTEMKTPCGNVPVIPNSKLKGYTHLRDVEITEPPIPVIDLLLGVDNADLITSDRKISGDSKNHPIAGRCPLGWFIQGGPGSNSVSVNHAQLMATSDIEQFLGIVTSVLEPKPCKCALDVENRLATEKMERSLRQTEDGAYEISLPWKKSPENLPNNYDYAMKRLVNLEKQFKNKPQEWELYC